MSDIIYIKDILLKKSGESKKRSGRPKLKPFDQKNLSMSLKSEKVVRKRKITMLRSSLVEQDKQENKGCRK